MCDRGGCWLHTMKAPYKLQQSSEIRCRFTVPIDVKRKQNDRWRCIMQAGETGGVHCSVWGTFACVWEGGSHSNSKLLVVKKRNHICGFSGAWKQYPETLLFSCSVTWNIHKPVSKMKPRYTHTHSYAYMCENTAYLTVHRFIHAWICVCTHSD